jgi:hypothetical protein
MIVPLLALISPAAASRLEAKLGIEFVVDSGLERPAACSAALGPKATGGGSLATFVTRQLEKTPAIEDESEAPLASVFPRGDAGEALGAIEDPA